MSSYKLLNTMITYTQCSVPVVNNKQADAVVRADAPITFAVCIFLLQVVQTGSGYRS
jgi:hypothetical protein